MLNKLNKWFKKEGWFIEYNNKPAELNVELIQRYGIIDEQYMKFLNKYKRVISKDEKTWFICCQEYNGDSEYAFSWNEFENLSLEAAADDEKWKKEISEWWDKKMPIIMSVKDRYCFYALDLSQDKKGTVVRGEEPEFEETEIVADSFNDFLYKVINKQVIL